MATVPVSLIRTATRAGLLAVPLLAVLTAGCVMTDDLQVWKSEKKADAPVCQVLCMWQNSVQFAPDPTRNGKPGAGLAGRLYLFGKSLGHPHQSDGSLVVDLFDETDGKSVHQEQWRIDPETLRSLVSKDFVGTGYSLFLPWSCYRPETSKVRLRVGFLAAGSSSAVFNENVITLAEGNGVIREGGSSVPMMPMMPASPAGPLGVNPSLPMGPTRLPPPTMVK